METLTPTKAESESDWWKTSLEYFEGKGVQSEAVSEQLEIEKDSLSEEVQKKKKRKRGSSPPSFQNPTYEQLMTRHINAFIEVMMRKRPCNAQWTLGHSELVAFYKDSSNLMSMVSVVDAVRATIDGTNPRYPSWEKISQKTFVQCAPWYFVCVLYWCITELVHGLDMLQITCMIISDLVIKDVRKATLTLFPLSSEIITGNSITELNDKNVCSFPI
ncbi:hypothetical protein Tco_1534882 [Tanacetum coccineum]